MDDGTEPHQGPDASVPPPTSAELCKRVDLVIAVDASYTMQEELEAMSTDVFPAFADALRNIGDGLEDYRVGVLDACPVPANFHTRGKAVEDCQFQSGEVWMDSNSTALHQEFSCVADLYTEDIEDYPGGCTGDNDDEQPISATIAALSDPFISGANAGFLREDALLVVVAITDEDEQPEPEVEPEELFERLVASKGDVSRIVFLGIGSEDGCTAEEGAYGRARSSRRLSAVTDMFIENHRGVFWDLCIGRLEDGLQQAMEVIEAGCSPVE